MATKMDSAEKAFEAATLETPATPAVTPAAPVETAAPAVAKAAPAPVKTPTVKAKAKPVAKKAAAPKAVAKKAAPKKAVVKTIAPKPLKAAPKPVAAATKGFKTMNDTVKKFADEAKTRAEALTADFNAKAKEAVEFNKANLEALVEAGKIAAKNAEVLGQEGVTFARKSFEDTTAALKGYTAVKSPTEFFKLYAENSKKAFDAAVAQTSKTSELVVKMANDSFAPISNRVSVITSKMKAA